MSGLTVKNNDLSLLDRLAKLDSSAMRVTDDGKKIVTDAGMAFRSGLNRTFHGGKTEADTVANKKTLETVMNYIKDQTNDEVHGRVLDTKFKLAGDSKAYSMRERMEVRGTYMSSTLAKELKYITQKAIRETDPELIAKDNDSRRYQMYQPGNLRAMDRFLGREPRDNYENEAHKKFDTFVDFAAQTIKGALATLASKITGEGQRETPLRQAVLDLAETGTTEIPKEQTRVWQTFKDYFLKSDADPKNEEARDVVLQKLEYHLYAKCGQAAKEGKAVSEGDLKKWTGEFLAEKRVMARFIELTNIKIAQDLTPQGLAEGIRKWPEAHDRKDLQNAADWLANSIGKLDPEKMPEPLRHLPRNDKLLTAFEDLFRKGNWIDQEKICIDLLDTVLANTLTEVPKPNLGDLARYEWLEEQHPEGLEAPQHYFAPKEFTDKDIGRLMGRSIEGLLEEHKQVMESQPQLKAEIDFREGRAQTLKDNVPFTILPSIHTLMNETSAEEFKQIGMPETACDLVMGKFLPYVEKREIQWARNAVIEEKGPEALNDPQVQEKIARDVRMKVSTREGLIMKEVLPTLDDYVRFQKEVDKILDSPDGFAGVDRATLERLDDEALRLIEGGKEVGGLAMALSQRYSTAKIGDEVVHGSVMLGEASYAIQTMCERYRTESGSVLRDIERFLDEPDRTKKAMDKPMETDLDVMVRQIEAKIEKEKLERADEIREATKPDDSLKWASDSLKTQLKHYPDMEQLASKARNPQLLENYHTVAGLFEGMMLGGQKISVQESFSVRDLLTNPMQAIDKQREADAKWAEDVRPMLVSVFDEFAALQSKVDGMGGVEALKTADAQTRDELHKTVEKLVLNDLPKLQDARSVMRSSFRDGDIVPIEDFVTASMSMLARMFHQSMDYLQALQPEPPKIEPPNIDPPKRDKVDIGLDVALKVEDNAEPPKVEPPKSEPPKPESQLTFKAPSFKERLEGYPTLQKLAEKTKLSDSPSTRTMAGMLSELVLEPERRKINEDLKGSRHGAERTLREQELDARWKDVSDGIEVIDAFAALRVTTSQMTQEDWLKLTPDDRRELRERTESAFEGAAKINSPLNIITNELRNARKVVPTRDITDAFYATGARIREDARVILTKLDELDRMN